MENMNQETYSNWVGVKFDKIKALDRIEQRQCQKKCSNVVEYDDDEDVENGYIHKFVSWNCEMVFLKAFVSEYEKAENRLNYLIPKIDGINVKTRLPYIDGYKYVIDTLKRYIEFRKGSLSQIDRHEFKDLNPQAQICVLSMKLLFYKEDKDSLDTQVLIVRKLIQLDRTNPIWHESLATRLRLLRNLSFSGIAVPTLDEKTSFERAYQLRQDVPQFFASFSRFIAEKLKNAKFNSKTQVVRISIENQLIDTVEDVLNFMKKHTRFLLDAAVEIDAKYNAAKAIATMGEVFSTSLPKKLQDLDLAEECMKAAINIRPTCYKSNHRMGIFQFKKRHNYESALEYLSAAVQSKRNNFFALIDWITLLLYRVDNNINILNDVFENTFSNDSSWTTNEKARLVFLKGCFVFMTKEDKTEAMNLWMEAYKTNEMGSHFKKSFMDAKRFGWKKFDASEIQKFLPTSSVDPIVRKMTDEVAAEVVKSKAIAAKIDRKSNVVKGENSSNAHS